MKKALISSCAAIIVVLVSGGCALFFSTKTENEQYIPDSLKNTSKKNLAQVWFKNTLWNSKDIVSIDDTEVKYPMRGLMVEMWTYGLTNHDPMIYS